MKLRRRSPVSRRRSSPKKKRHTRWEMVRKHERRVNAGIAPFIAAPVANPARRRRRNPALKLNLQSIGKKVLNYGAGSALGFAVDHYAISRLNNKWLRNGARVAGAVAAGMFLGPKYAEVSASAAGALMYPLMQELAAQLLPAGSVSATSADLDVLAADLTEAIEDYETEAAEEALF